MRRAVNARGQGFQTVSTFLDLSRWIVLPPLAISNPPKDLAFRTWALCYLFAMNKLILALALLLTPLYSHAAIFDAADILPQNAGALGIFTELLLSDPTSEGVEARARYGLTDAWNVGLNIGGGSKGKKFRMGGETVFNVLPDWEGQLGLSGIASATYLRRLDGGGMQFRIGPMIHKRLTGWIGMPANIYLAIPWYQEIRGSTFTSGTQLVLGTNFDIADAGRFYAVAELGIKLAKTDSYILVGVGTRLGDLAFNRGAANGKKSGVPRSGKRNSDEEYTDEDFKK
jgi:hypothetical protein